MAVRRQLLERELRSVAARNGKARAISPPDDSPHDGHTGHPQADAPDEEHAA